MYFSVSGDVKRVVFSSSFLKSLRIIQKFLIQTLAWKHLYNNVVARRFSLSLKSYGTFLDRPYSVLNARKRQNRGNFNRFLKIYDKYFGSDVVVMALNTCAHGPAGIRTRSLRFARAAIYH